MRRVFLLALAVVLTGMATIERAAAQKIELGARAGITSQDMDLKLTDVLTDSKLGWHLAAVSRIRIVGFGDGMLGAGLFAQPEIVYSQNNFKMQKTDKDGVSKVRMQSVDIPLLLSLKVSIARVQVGPVFNVMNKYSSIKGEIKMDPIRPTVGYAIGASVDILGFTLDGRYHGEFNKLKNNIRDDAGTLGEDIRSSLSSWSLGLSILF